MIDKTPGYIFTTRILILSFCLWFEYFLHTGQDPLINVVDVHVGVVLLGQRLAVGQRDLVGHLLVVLLEHKHPLKTINQSTQLYVDWWW